MSGAISNILKTFDLHHDFHSFMDEELTRLNVAPKLVVGKPRFKCRKLVLEFMLSTTKLNCF